MGRGGGKVSIYRDHGCGRRPCGEGTAWQLAIEKEGGDIDKEVENIGVALLMILSREFRFLHSEIRDIEASSCILKPLLRGTEEEFLDSLNSCRGRGSSSCILESSKGNKGRVLVFSNLCWGMEAEFLHSLNFRKDQRLSSCILKSSKDAQSQSSCIL
ncbi:uncharacterized protein G2W53_017548 [Senna tora]|uniref:Uncharacterized protein n=1 Tax=Senna tora TaxID=362788 RepID=A0A834WQX0_9FABA|nr:uncharacterized protein G2W53_017548 [Senna tora]